MISICRPSCVSGRDITIRLVCQSKDTRQPFLRAWVFLQIEEVCDSEPSINYWQSHLVLISTSSLSCGLTPSPPCQPSLGATRQLISHLLCLTLGCMLPGYMFYKPAGSRIRRLRQETLWQSSWRCSFAVKVSLSCRDALFKASFVDRRRTLFPFPSSTGPPSHSGPVLNGGWRWQSSPFSSSAT